MLSPDGVFLSVHAYTLSCCISRSVHLTVTVLLAKWGQFMEKTVFG